MNVVIASSSIDCGIGCWDLQTGAEQLRYKTCASPPHGLTSVGCRFLACSQLRDPSATSGHVFYWSWFKPQAEVKSFPAEPIKPLAANSEGSYIVGGGSSGDIYFWEVATGRLLRKWHAHYRAVTSLVFSEDNSLLISGSEDGCVRVWSLFIAIIVSASEDRTCKVWSLFRGRLLRNIVFPSIIDAIALDPGEHVFYAGSRDGKIYIAALNAESSPSSSYGLHIIGSLSDHSKPVTCLAYSAEGNLLLSGSEDGLVRVWDVKTQNIIRMFRHAKGPVNNILIVRRPLPLGRAGSKEQASSRRHETSLPPPLEKYANSTDEDMDNKAIITLPATSDLPSYLSAQLINDHVKELQQQSSSAAAEMEVKRLKLDCKRSMQMVQQLKNVYDNLQEFCVNELLDGEQMEGSEGKSL
ncbi:protein ROOT INITIATION DEFECTIVE 3 isoform X2 [Durio zibethinus]|uniref:Protein ROOT INITIATION DEFECTIVE 3 isoform X2 n=1 Tax=Durio zibethinus TaxID=66656 RepID=A0A6P6AVA2_DURZI|nr:protein ROOT INITIATION DEFECTIVE 3 isoform X2 [Durio zibethinus]